MNLKLDNKVALVTGSSRGIGKAIAEKFAEEGCKKIIICARGSNDLEKTKQEIELNYGSEVLAIQADLTKASDIYQLGNDIKEHFDGVDILINNIGGPPAGSFQNFSLQEWQSAINLNLFSIIHVSKMILPYMQEKRWGRIINMTSISVKQPLINLILSNTVRSGVIGLTKSMAIEYAPDNILINSIAPGYTETERVNQIISENAKKNKTSFDKEKMNILKQIPLGKMAKPIDIANCVVFLCSEQASYITGVTIQVDGGFIKSIL